MSIDSELQKHYAQLLGVGSPWEVKNVELNLADKKVEIELGWQWGAAPSAQNAGTGVRFTMARRSGPGGTWIRCRLRP
ncbi:MAG TPA: hypothetical protein PK807_13195 [Verrucomicrobiota bacterium]|nr:hypothetical protein [Verrucomicrobiota bacterium]